MAKESLLQTYEKNLRQKNTISVNPDFSASEHLLDNRFVFSEEPREVQMVMQNVAIKDDRTNMPDYVLDIMETLTTGASIKEIQKKKNISDKMIAVVYQIGSECLGEHVVNSLLSDQTIKDIERIKVLKKEKEAA